MISIFTENQKAIEEAIEKITKNESSSVADMLLTASLLEDRKGEIYEAVYRNYDEIFKAEVVQDKGTRQFSIVRKAWEGKSGKYGWTNVLAAEFSCWPKDNDGLLMSFASIREDIKSGKFKKHGEVGKAFIAINRYNAWVSGYQLGVIRKYIDELNVGMLERITAETIASQKAITPEELEKAKVDAKTKFEAQKLEGKSPSRQAVRILDAAGNVKKDKIADLPIETAKALSLELAKSNPEVLAQALTVATGQAVTALPGVSELRASSLLTELRKHLGEFKVPTEAATLITQLETMLVAEQGTVASTKTVIVRKKTSGTKSVAA